MDGFITSSQRNSPAPVQDEQSRQFYEQIRGKEIGAGQIQFWNMSEPYRSPNAAQANFALVYLYAGEARYELVYSREPAQAWQIESLRDSSQPGLF